MSITFLVLRFTLTLTTTVGFQQLSSIDRGGCPISLSLVHYPETLESPLRRKRPLWVERDVSLLLPWWVRGRNGKKNGSEVRRQSRSTRIGSPVGRLNPRLLQKVLPIGTPMACLVPSSSSLTGRTHDKLETLPYYPGRSVSTPKYYHRVISNRVEERYPCWRKLPSVINGTPNFSTPYTTTLNNPKTSGETHDTRWHLKRPSTQNKRYEIREVRKTLQEKLRISF